MRDPDIDYDQIINGAFVKGFRIKNDITDYVCWIKLNEIKKILEGYDYEYDNCFFYTYKDCKYMTLLSCEDLIKLVSDFVFRKDGEENG